jgi:hypothetical protein|tara:strand:- start:178 stop:384 length:207 start_codon:yes stop_codon:yes gene_type:complete
MTYLVINAHESDASNVMNDIYANELNQVQAKRLLHDEFPFISYDFLTQEEFNEECLPFKDEYEFCRFN